MRSPLSAAALALACCATRLGAQDAPAPPPPVIRGGVELVRVDVVVTDHDGRHVPDLRADEFTLEEDGQPRTVAALRYVTHGRTADTTPGPAATPVASEPPPAAEPRSMAMVVDDPSFSDESRVRVARVVRHLIALLATPDTPVFLMRTGGGPNAVQDFTTDQQRLAAVVARLRPAPRDMSGDPVPSVERTLQVLRMMQALVDGLEERPGRKTLLLFSEGLALATTKDEPDTRALDALRRLTDTANQAGVTISTIDPAGLRSERFSASDVFDQGPKVDSAALRTTLSEAPAKAAAVRRQLRRGPEGLSKETGGLSLFDSNDLKGAALRVWNDQDGYYLIGYEPEAASVSSSDGESVEHAITVRVKRKDLVVRSRRVYYARAAEPGPAAP